MDPENKSEEDHIYSFMFYESYLSFGIFFAYVIFNMLYGYLGKIAIYQHF